MEQQLKRGDQVRLQRDGVTFPRVGTVVGISHTHKGAMVTVQPANQIKTEIHPASHLIPATNDNGEALATREPWIAGRRKK